MNKEFPMMEDREHHREFLKNWYSRAKLFRGKRQSGKTTLMLCEARRFSESGLEVLFLSPTKDMSLIIRDKYKQLFGEQPQFRFGSYHSLERGHMKGYNPDAVILDEFQNISFETFQDEVVLMRPHFYRASACLDTMNAVHYLRTANEGGFFDSIYSKE